MGTPAVGVLALQGAFAKHIEMLKNLNVNAKEVRYPHDLIDCDGLIIPGGESTTIMRQINYIGLEEPLRDFAEKKPVFGTCAGLILMSKEILHDKMKPFGWLDVIVERNAFGRQADSFRTDIELLFNVPKHRTFSALFIRAPRIRDIGSGVKVLAKYEDEPILIEQGHHLGATFHPELTEDVLIHAHFLKLVESSRHK